MGKPFRYQWLDAIRSTSGPKSPMTRWILANLCKHANSDGSNCFPTIELQAKETGATEKTVRNCLNDAEAEGWIKRQSRKDKGQAWRNYVYELLIPDNVRQLLPHVDDKVRQELPHVDDQRCGNSFQKVRYLVPEGAVTVTDYFPSSSPVVPQKEPPIPPTGGPGVSGEDLETVKTYVNYINSKTGRHFSAKSPKTQKRILERVREGYSFDEIITVIDARLKVDGLCYLNKNHFHPESIFGPENFKRVFSGG